MDSQKIKNLGIVLVLFLLLLLFGYQCPFQKMTGLPCPGCNMTTSLYYLLKGNIRVSLYYHALLIPTLFVGIICVLLGSNKKRIKTILILWCTIMILYYLYRMIFIFPNAPMVYDTTSLIYRIFLNRKF